MTKSHYSQDPNAHNEAQNYDEPIPSREYIKLALKQAERELKIKDLIKYIGVLPQHEEGFKHRLKAMIRDGEVVQNKKKFYKIAQTLPTLTGKVSAHPDGFGFIISPETTDKLFCSAREMSKVIDGDEVLVKIISQSRSGRAEVIIDKVLQHNTHSVVGKLYAEKGKTLVRSLNKKQPDVIITSPPKKITHDYVCVDITRQPTAKSPPMGEISEVIKAGQNRSIDVELAIKTHQLPHEWSRAQMLHTKQYHHQISNSECEEEIKQGRKDLRHLPFCTIDGQDAKDFDDAVYCQQLDQNHWKLFVSIADVSHYIHSDDILDKEAKRRGNSIYFPGQVIPMLPEELSNGLCSLNPNVNRFSLSCEMKVNSQGEVTDFSFYPSVIQSTARLTYKKVNTLLKNAEHPEWQEYSQDTKQSLHQLRNLYQVQKKARIKRGAIDIESNSVEFTLSEKGHIKNIQRQKLKLSHRIIEECMLMANVCAARFLEQHDKAFLYRVHDQPKIQKVYALGELLNDLDIDFKHNETPSPHAFSQVLKTAKDTPYKNIVQTAVLRTFKKAIYSAENLHGHFGLNYPSYTHFTSPIRRYPDLIVHRAIKEVLSAHKKADKAAQMAQLKTLGEHLSHTEKRADEATREVTERLKCEYASHHINKTFKGTVSSVTHFGLFIDLDKIYTEGLLHVSSLGKDYFIYDEIHHCLYSEKSKKRYEIGTRLQVRLTQVNIEEGKIYLELI